MDRKDPETSNAPNDVKIMQMNIPARMFIACSLACILGMVLMAATEHYLLMGFFIALLIVCVVDVPLVHRHIMSVETASLIPIVCLCFLYTPLSWFAFDGLMGCTPYLSILFAMMIIFAYYRRIHRLLLPLYSLMLVGLLAHWLLTSAARYDRMQMLNVLIAYVIAYTVTAAIAEGVKIKNIEINQHITNLSLRDGLTDLLNRRAVEEVLQEREQAYAVNRVDYALVMMDVDHFKTINDEYGHPIGDAVLQTLAQCIQRMIRSQDYAFRYGGDEFLLVLTNVDDVVSSQIQSRIGKALRDVHDYAFPITVSVGGVLRSECAGIAAAMALADRRMYESKNAKHPS